MIDPAFLPARYFPTTGTAGNPNRQDGIAHAAGVVPATIARLRVPGGSRLTIVLTIAVIRTLPAAPVLGASYVIAYAAHRDPSNPPVLDAGSFVLNNADGAYVIGAAALGDDLAWDFTGLAGEEYEIVTSVEVFAARAR